MLFRLLLLFTIVPFVELALLIEVGRRIGTGWTLLLIIGTGIAGGLLARSQGLAVLRQIRHEINEGRVPGVHLVDGVLVLVGGLLLLTPGILTDIVGILLMVPASRMAVRLALIRGFEHWVQYGSFRIMGPRFRR